MDNPNKMKKKMRHESRRGFVGQKKRVDGVGRGKDEGQSAIK